MDILILFMMVVGFMLIGVPIAVSLGLSSIIFSDGAFRFFAGLGSPNSVFCL